jgi:hypothetical protein
VAENLPSKHEALRSNPSTEKKLNLYFLNFYLYVLILKSEKIYFLKKLYLGSQAGLCPACLTPSTSHLGLTWDFLFLPRVTKLLPMLTFYLLILQKSREF